MAVRGRLCFVSSCKINHFGINPVSGGSPPSESSTRAVVAVRAGFLDHATARVLILVVDEIFRVRKAADVIMIYVNSASRVSWGAYCKTIIIQPIWAIEE